MSCNEPLSSHAAGTAPATQPAAQPLEGTLPAAAAPISSDIKADRLELSVRTLQPSELDLAVRLYASTPGWSNYAYAFRSDALKLMAAPPSAVVGAFLRDGTLVGTGCAVKEMFDFAYWSITWVMVDGALRGQGVGAQVVRAIEDYMVDVQSKEYNNPNCRVLLSAVDENAEKFYARLGYTTLLKGPLIEDNEVFMYRDVRGPGLRLKVELRT